MQLQVTNSPFNQEQVELLNRLLPSLTETQQIWLTGYFFANQSSAVAVQGGVQAITEFTAPADTISKSTQPAVSREATVLFGSQTGNCQRVATSFARKLEEQGLQVTLAPMNKFKTNNLKKVENLFLVVSTHGEGEPPDNARSLHEFLYSKRAPQLENVYFSVLSLGDTSYEFFCQTGKDFDQRLEELGAKRLSPRVDCDLDYDEPVAGWSAQVMSQLNERLNAGSSTAAASVIQEISTDAATDQSAYSRTNPFKAEVLANVNLNGRGSDRETRHLELSLEGSNLQYEPGDSLGVYPENHPELVDAIINQMGWNAEEIVPLNKNGDLGSLREALLKHYEITSLSKPLLTQAAELSGSNGLRELLAPGQEQTLKSYTGGRDLLDLVQDFAPWQGTATQFVAILRKLPARLYSIASSFKANEDEVHLTIRAVRYEAHGRDRFGVCSVHCAERVQPGDSLPIYIQQNPNFKLPADSDAPIIMIGPGTGVAPFRAFLEEREELGAEGKSWLFYGDRHFVTDFLYQTDWQRMLKDGVLTKLDLAFSRDTEEKVYVQHRLLQRGRELFEWLQAGAYVYICGDEKYMAHDVHKALLTIIEQEGGLSAEQAAAYLNDMQDQQRYQRDVY